MAFNISKIGNSDAIVPLPTKADYDREEQEFQAKRAALIAKAAAAGKGGNLPAPMQIAAKMQELQNTANNPNASPTERAQAASLYNHLGQAAKTYGFDRGVQYDNAATPEQIGGFANASGGIKATEKGMEQQAQKDVDLQMNPQIAGGEAGAKLQQDLTYQPTIDAQKKAALDAVAAKAAAAKAVPGQEAVDARLQTLRDAYSDLQKQGADISPTNTVMHNVAARARSSAPGQYLEGFLGTKAQVDRDNIAVTQPALLNAIRQVSNLPAGALRTNAELRFWIKMSTDPTRSQESNNAAIEVLHKQYGVGSGKDANPAEIQKLKDEYIQTPKSSIPSAEELGVTDDTNAVPDQPILPAELPATPSSGSGFKVIRRIR